MARLLVFDLDLTLWHCGRRLWCDQLTPPLSRNADGRVFAACRTEVSLYPDVPLLLDELEAAGHRLAVASRTDAPEIAQNLLRLFGIDAHFTHRQIYPGDKAAHFRALHEETGTPFDDMVFFDDERRNIDSVGRLGVAAHHVAGGLTRAHLERALDGSF